MQRLISISHLKVSLFKKLSGRFFAVSVERTFYLYFVCISVLRFDDFHPVGISELTMEPCKFTKNCYRLRSVYGIFSPVKSLLLILRYLSFWEKIENRSSERKRGRTFCCCLFRVSVSFRFFSFSSRFAS
jgi:hypothetical protein